MTECAPLIVLAALWVPEGSRRKLVFAGALCALAVYFRYQNGLLLAGFFLSMLAGRRFRGALVFAAGASAVIAAGCVLDWLTWGGPFHPLAGYMQYNLIEGKSAAYGVEEAGYYLTVAWTSTGVAFVPLLFGFVASVRRALGLALVAATYVAIHSLVAHKELRVLVPVLPLILALAGAGLVVGAQATWRLLLHSTHLGQPKTGHAHTKANRRKGTGRSSAAEAHAPLAAPLPSVGALAVGTALGLLLLCGASASSATFERLGQYVGQQ